MRLSTAFLSAAFVAGVPVLAAAQHVEVGPIGGYWFGGGFFERVTGQEDDLDGEGALQEVGFRHGSPLKLREEVWTPFPRRSRGRFAGEGASRF